LVYYGEAFELDVEHDVERIKSNFPSIISGLQA